MQRIINYFYDYMTQGTDNSKKIILNKKQAAIFRKAEKDQKVLEAKARKMDYMMPLSKMLNEQIERIEKLKEKNLLLYDKNGEPIKTIK